MNYIFHILEKKYPESKILLLHFIEKYMLGEEGIEIFFHPFFYSPFLPSLSSPSFLFLPFHFPFFFPLPHTSIPFILLPFFFSCSFFSFCPPPPSMFYILC